MDISSSWSIYQRTCKYKVSCGSVFLFFFSVVVSFFPKWSVSSLNCFFWYDFDLYWLEICIWVVLSLLCIDFSPMQFVLKFWEVLWKNILWDFPHWLENLPCHYCQLGFLSPWIKIMWNFFKWKNVFFDFVSFWIHLLQHFIWNFICKSWRALEE